MTGRTLFVLAAAIASVVPQAATHTIYVTAAAADGSAVTDIHATDLLVKEGGQIRRVLAVEPSRSKLQVAIAVEELLTPDDEVRRSVANFIDQVRGHGELALYVVGRRSEKRAGYTSDVLPFAGAINRFAVRSVERGDIVQALREIARDQRGREGRRAIVAVAVEGAQPSNVTAEAVIEQISAARSVLYAATLASAETSTAPPGMTSGGRHLDLEGQVSGLERDKVFNDATRQSGGLHVSSPRTAGLWAALERVAAELRQQFVVSFEGTANADDTVAIDNVRPGVSVRGSTRVRERVPPSTTRRPPRSRHRERQYGPPRRTVVFGLPPMVASLFSEREVLMRWSIALTVVAAAVVLNGRSISARIDDLPSGERQLGRTVIEPAYDDRDGSIVYLSTPLGTPFPSKSNPKSWAPLYLVEYPNTASTFAGTMNCAHQPADNCADHGPGIAQFAASMFPSVYGPPDGSGVWGHDHLVDGPGGSEFNVAWQVHLIFFTNELASHTHVVTDAQVDDLLRSGNAVDIPDVTFQCAVVSGATYRRATPLPTAGPALLSPVGLR
jgi:hypothetical protein